MQRIVIDNLDLTTAERLGRSASRHGRSLDDEAKCILQCAFKQSLEEALEEAASWREKVGDGMRDSVEMVREDRNRWDAEIGCRHCQEGSNPFNATKA